jgi:hypothetical protein
MAWREPIWVDWARRWRVRAPRSRGYTKSGQLAWPRMGNCQGDVAFPGPDPTSAKSSGLIHCLLHGDAKVFVSECLRPKMDVTSGCHIRRDVGPYAHQSGHHSGSTRTRARPSVWPRAVRGLRCPPRWRSSPRTGHVSAEAAGCGGPSSRTSVDPSAPAASASGPATSPARLRRASATCLATRRSPRSGRRRRSSDGPRSQRVPWPTARLRRTLHFQRS